MALTDYTTTDSVRAILGVSFKEIQDTVLLDPIYSIRLSEDLLGVHPDLTSLLAATVPVDPKSPEQQRFVDLMNAYAAYQVAYQCLGAIRMFAPVTIKDSRSEVTRGDDPYKDLRADILSTLMYLRALILKVLVILVPGTILPVPVTRRTVLAIPLGTNPVTG